MHIIYWVEEKDFFSVTKKKESKEKEKKNKER